MSETNTKLSTAGAVAGVFLVRAFQGPLTVVVLAAVPFVGLTLYSKSSAGKKLQDDLEAKLPELREVGKRFTFQP